MHNINNRTKKKLADYNPLPYRIPHLDLEFVLDPNSTKVTSRFLLQSNLLWNLDQDKINTSNTSCIDNSSSNSKNQSPKNSTFNSDTIAENYSTTKPNLDIILDGNNLVLVSISMNGNLLNENDYQLTDVSITIPNRWKWEEIYFEIVTRISPIQNTELIGLYQSSGIYCTQNEPEGFRRITYYLDRPDVLSTYRVRIQSGIELPYLLSNGNRIETGIMPNGDRFAIWEDPFPKPSYLFALVAGDLDKLEDSFQTFNGHKIKLEIYTNSGKSMYAEFAMESLKLAMKWDEEVFHREYDLDLYMIVAVDDFNMGAMENKGLNIFNSKLVLASPETATDTMFEDILSVIAHEYFHNWSGNRITIRDWFQLTLKEGLTVFRDQLFSQDMIGSVKRIDDVDFLRNYQFPEDQGKLSHPIQPKEYLDIDNFYTRTVYEKGAEVIRMLYTITGKEGFVQVMDEYFRRYDGMAVTTCDYIKVFEDYGYDLEIFKNWYDRKGTSKIVIHDEYLETESTYRITWEDKNYNDTGIILHYPVHYTLHDPNQECRIETGTLHWKGRSGVCNFTGFNLQGLQSRPVLSIFQEFSSPVEWDWDRPVEDLFYLWLHDPDPFTRQDSSFKLKLGYIRHQLGEIKSIPLDSILKSYNILLGNLPENGQELRLLAYLIRIPSLTAITNLQDNYQIESTYTAIQNLSMELIEGVGDRWFKVYNLASDKLIKNNWNRLEASGIRYFRNSILEFLALDEEFIFHQFQSSLNMTDRIATLKVLSQSSSKYYSNALDDFAYKWKHNPLVMDYWLTIQASSNTHDCFERVKELKNSDYFDITNPNRVASLLGSFTRNRLRFHQTNGDTYRWICDVIIELDSVNSQSASRLAKSFSDLAKLPSSNQKIIRECLENIKSHNKLSNLVFEVLDSILS